MPAKGLPSGERLGGGIVLLPNGVKPEPSELFQLHRPYPFGEDVFCVEQGILDDAYIPLHLQRLERIHQLQLLTWCGIGTESKNAPTFCSTGYVSRSHIFSHYRFAHSLRSAAVQALMATAVGISGKDMEVGALADIMHDNFTCAGGDAWKDANAQMSLFDEDHDFAQKIMTYCGEGWRWICGKYGLNPYETALDIEDIVFGRGLRGEIHEIADTASYMLGDLAEIRKARKHWGVYDFQNAVDASRAPWDIWKSAAKAGERIVITDKEKLNNFLRLRAMLWGELYQNCAHKFLELLMKVVVFPHMVANRMIKTEFLPVKDDPWLFGLVERKMGFDCGSTKRLNLLGSWPRMEELDSWQGALVQEEKLYRQGCFTLLVSLKNFQIANSKTDKYLVSGQDGQPATFKEACPKEAGEIEEMISESVNHVKPCLYFVENPKITPDFARAWAQARKKWRQSSL